VSVTVTYLFSVSAAVMEASTAKILASAVVLFLFAADLAKNEPVFSVAAAATARVSAKNEPTLEGPDKECSIPLNQTVWFPQTMQCETLLTKCSQLFKFLFWIHTMGEFLYKTVYDFQKNLFKTPIIGKSTKIIFSPNQIILSLRVSKILPTSQFFTNFCILKT